jgi:hypothetical protein
MIQRLRASENKALRNVFGSKKGEVKLELKRLHDN